jgi:hypothetical protein
MAAYIFRKLRILFRRDKFNRELQEEMSFHRDLAEKELIADGMAAEDAHYAARRQFGNQLRLSEESHLHRRLRVRERFAGPSICATPAQEEPWVRRNCRSRSHVGQRPERDHL